MQTIPQDEVERLAKPTTNIRVYESSALDLLELQVKELRETGSKPTQADLVERAMELYKSQKPEAKRAR